MSERGFEAFGVENERVGGSKSQHCRQVRTGVFGERRIDEAKHLPIQRGMSGYELAERRGGDRSEGGGANSP